MICVSIGEKTTSEVLVSLKNLSFAEIRLDKIEDLNIKNLEQIFSMEISLIATFRKGSASQKKRELFLIKTIQYGTDYIDIDIHSDKKFIKNIMKEAAVHNVKTIISYHNFESTPPFKELSEIYNKIKKTGSDIIKIACKVNDITDNIKLLKLLENKKDLITIGMGMEGKITRLAGLFLGSPFTYASLSKEKETANGQIDLKTLNHMIEDMNQ